MPRTPKHQEIITAQAATIRELEDKLAAAQKRIDDAVVAYRALQAKHAPKPVRVAPVRYYNEFSSRKAALRWARMFRGRVMQAPTQRAEG